MEISSPHRAISAVIRAFYFTFLLCLYGIVPAAFAQDNWKGGTGNWNDGTKWSAGVPTSSSSVNVDHGTAGASSVTVSDNEQSGNLTIDSDDGVTLVTGARLNVFGPTISNAGTISLAATTSQASLDITGPITLTGAGVLSMSNNANNAICFNCVQNTGKHPHQSEHDSGGRNHWPELRQHFQQSANGQCESGDRIDPQYLYRAVEKYGHTGGD